MHEQRREAGLAGRQIPEADCQEPLHPVVTVCYGPGMPTTTEQTPQYESQSARDAQAAGYGDADYWQYLDDAAREHRDSFIAEGDPVMAERMMTESLSDALRGNDGE